MADGVSISLAAYALGLSGGGAALMFAASVCVHELGHWLAAKVVGGFSVRAIRIWPYEWTRLGTGAWHRQRVAKGGARNLGFIRVEPASIRALRGRALVFLAGGPAASLVAAAASAAALVDLLHDPLTRSNIVALTLCGHGALLNLMQGLAALVPVARRPPPKLSTDGRQLLDLLRSDPQALARWTTVVVQAAVREGRPASAVLDAPTLERWRRRQPADSYLALLALLLALAQGRVEAAKGLARSALAAPRSDDPQSCRGDFATYAVAIAVFADADLASAATALAELQACVKVANDARLFLAAAVLAVAEDKPEVAAGALGTFDRAAAACANPAMYRELFLWITGHVRGPGQAPAASARRQG